MHKFDNQLLLEIVWMKISAQPFSALQRREKRQDKEYAFRKVRKIKQTLCLK